MISAVILTIKVLLGLVLLFLCFEGWGITICFGIKKLFKNNLYQFSIWDNFWIGFAFILLMLQIVHLFLKIDIVVSLLVVGIGTIIAVIALVTNIKKINLKENIPLIVLSLIIVLLLSNLVFTGGLGYDFGLYYRQTMNWIQSYPIIEGLANIHGRLGFNNGSFLMASLIDNLNIIPQSFRLFSCSICTIVLVYCLKNMLLLFKTKEKKISHIYWSLAFFLVLSFIFLRNGVYFVSAGADTFATMLELVVGGYILQCVENKGLGKNYIVLLFILATLFCIKLSTAVFVLSSLLVIFIILLKYERKLLKSLEFWIFSFIIMLLGSVWFVRSTILTGFPLYPSTVLNFNLSWSVGTASAIDMMQWIESWAKVPKLLPSQVLGSYSWIKTWFKSNISNVYLLIPFLFSMCLGISAIFSKGRRNRYWLLLIITIPALMYWFLKAPDVRFAYSILWMTLIFTFIIFIKSFKNMGAIIPLFIVSIGSIFLLMSSGGYNFVPFKDYKSNITYPNIEFATIDKQENFNIYKPAKGESCWDKEFICVADNNITFQIVTNSEGKIVKVLAK